MATSTTSSFSSSPVLVLKRGGKHPIFGTYVGGSPLDNEYKLTQTHCYSSTSQLRTEKQLSVAESALYTQRSNTTTLKFNGKMDVKESNTASLSELNLEAFLNSVGDTVERFGLETFFYLPDSLGEMKYLPEDPHTFSLQSVLKEHNSRLTEPSPIVDAGVETPTSIIARFKCYDAYEMCDFSLSRLAIEALVHPDLRAEIVVQYNHMDNFKKYPGSIYLMMVLEVCHASFSFKMDEAGKSLEALTLSDFPGENISKFSNEAQRLIKIMKGGYALPYQLGSQILQKVCNTQSLYFNRTMYNLMDHALKLEKDHGPHRDPKLLEASANYSTYGPLGLCVAMRENYSDLVTVSQWPALATTLPASNLGEIKLPDIPKKNFKDMKCHICGSEFHLKADCPNKPTSDSEKMPGSKLGFTGAGKTSMATWRYIHPADPDSEITVNGIKYDFCKHCTCKFTGKQGFYNRTHNTSNHKFPRQKSDDASTAPTVASTVTGTSSISSLGSGSATPGCSLGIAQSKVRPNASPIPENGLEVPNAPPIPEDAIDPDPNGLEFVGAFMADASPNDAAWLTAAMDPPDIVLSTGALFESETSNEDNDAWFDATSDYDNENLADSGNYAVDDNVKSLHYSYVSTSSDNSNFSKFSLTSATLSGITWFLYATSAYYRTLLSILHFWKRIIAPPIFLLLFYISIVGWDTVDLYRSPPPLPRRTLRRRPPSPSRLRWYPRRWMLLSCYMLASAFVSPNTFQLPPLTPMPYFRQSWHRTIHLDSLVDFTSGTLLQFHRLQFATYFSSPPGGDHTVVTAREVGGAPQNCHGVGGSGRVLQHSQGVDGVRSSGGAYFFDCFSSMTAMDSFNTVTPCSLTPQNDIFDVKNICLPEATVQCDHHTSYDVTLDTFPVPALSPTPQSLIATALGDVNLKYSCAISSFPVIFDSGASLAITFDRSDFVGTIRPLSNQYLGGLANGLEIKGIGTVHWKFRSKTGVMTVVSSAYYVPAARARLISPQRLFNAAKGVTGRFLVEETHATLAFDGVGDIRIDYDTNNHLPTALGKNRVPGVVEVNLGGVLSDENFNLSPARKLLLHWHCRFGHKCMSRIQSIFRSAPFLSDRFLAASRCELPLCETCQYAKNHRQSTKGAVQKVRLTTDGAIHDGHLRPGNLVSVDHFESRLKGRTYTSYNGINSDKYVGGCIFVDSMSGLVHVEHQLGFSGTETIRAKQNFEKLALDHGVLINSYRADNGIFRANEFVSHIRELNQKLSFCGVNAHHKNGAAERAVRTVSECARALLLFSACHWKGEITSELWPMAVDYAVYLYNHLPNEKGIAPADLFTGVTVPRHKLKDCHIWGAPVYVLDPVLQAGKKLPRWQPRSRRGMFVGFSPAHSSDVPLILNLRTGHISPQYHVVFDNDFSTVPSISENAEPPPWWNELDLENRSLRVPLDDDDPSFLDKDWLSADELEERSRQEVRNKQLRRAINQPSPDPINPIDTTLAQTSSSSPDTIQLPSVSPPLQIQPVAQSTVQSAPSTHGTNIDIPATIPPTSSPSPTKFIPTPSPTVTSPSPRRSSRSTKGPRQSMRFSDEAYLLDNSRQSVKYTGEAHFASVPGPIASSATSSQLSYLAELETDLDSGEICCIDPRAYAAKFKTYNADNPSYQMAMSGEMAHEWQKAMIAEVKGILKQKTWVPISRTSMPKGKIILPGIWAFKLKRLPDGSPLKFKARYCVRGDKQIAGVDYFETYAPVVQWSTIRLVLTMVLSHGWVTRQVDYTNAFTQADLQEEVYIESPKGFERKDKKDMVLKLLKSLYGLRQAPKSFFDKLSSGLCERGFVQSELDKCLFMKKDMICVVYVDDTILAGPSSDALEELISSLGIADDEQRHKFELRDEGEVGDFLGIRIEKVGPTKFLLTQTGLIAKVLKEAAMEDCNSARTPCSTTPLGKDEDGLLFDEDWEYASIIGMLMYLATNSRPDIAYSVHQCARFTHYPKASHAQGVKRILRYLKGTASKGMTMHPTDKYTVNCFVDADFAGLWGRENEQDPISVKSRTGFVIMFMGCPLLWVSKLQTQIALSTMEAEYIALSHSMRELIGIREILKEIFNHVFNDKTISPNYVTTHKYGSIPQSNVYEDNESCLKFATLPKMSPRTKHIAIPYHFFRTKVQNLEIKVESVDTANQLADQFTKGLSQDMFEKARYWLMGW